MELIFDKFTYLSDIQNSSLKNVNYTFKNSITFCFGINGYLIRDFLYNNNNNYRGKLYFNEKMFRKDFFYLGDNFYFYKDNLENELIFYTKNLNLNSSSIEKRIYDTLKIINLDKFILKKNFDKMSFNERKKCQLAIALFINSKFLVFDYYEKGFCYKEIEILKKLIYKLNKNYKKSIVIISNNIENFMNIIDNIVVFNNSKVVYFVNKCDFYDNKLYKYIDKPKIVDFIMYLEKKGHNFDKYIDIKELLKAIYRDVENK